MKKFIIAILAILYMGTTTGATVHLHYCMGKLVGSELFHQKDRKQCGNCGMEKKSGKDKSCCKDQQKQVKLENDQQAALPFFQMMQVLAVAIPAGFFELPVANVASISEALPVSHAPPAGRDIAVYIRNCVFLI